MVSRLRLVGCLRLITDCDERQICADRCRSCWELILSLLHRPGNTQLSAGNVRGSTE